jgi:RES domain-containing protein
LVYTAESRALSILEVSVHLDLSEDLPSDRYLLEIIIPDHIQILELKLSDLSDRWNSKPPILETQFIGDDFVREQESAVLKVPSAIVPEESNFLINPQHPDFADIKVRSTKPFIFDERLQT